MNNELNTQPTQEVNRNSLYYEDTTSSKHHLLSYQSHNGSPDSSVIEVFAAKSRLLISTTGIHMVRAIP